MTNQPLTFLFCGGQELVSSQWVASGTPGLDGLLSTFTLSPALANVADNLCWGWIIRKTVQIIALFGSVVRMKQS